MGYAIKCFYQLRLVKKLEKSKPNDVNVIIWLMTMIDFMIEFV